MEGISFIFGSKSERTNPNLIEEKEILDHWKDILEKRYNHKFVVVSNTSEYTTLRPVNCLDILRLKYSLKAKWIKIYMTNETSKTMINDSRFDAQKKKTESMWKSTLIDTNIERYFDVLDKAYYRLIYFETK